MGTADPVTPGAAVEGEHVETVDLMSAELLADPHAGYGRLRERAPVLSGSLLGGPPQWLVTRYADVRRVLTDPRFVNNPAAAGGVDVRAAMMRKLGMSDDIVGYFTASITNADGADHARLRKLVSRAFTVRRVNGLRPRVEEITARLLDDLAAAGRDGVPVDLVEAFCYPLPITVICELVGVEEADRPRWHDAGRELATLDPERVPGIVTALVGHVHDVIARRRAEPRDDLVSALIAAREDDGDRLGEREMVTLVLSLVMAGHETTAHLIANSVAALLAHPGELARLRADPSLWPRAVHELMRLRGPAQITGTRYPVEDVELGGVRIPAGSPVMPVLIAANGDPREFDDPARLDVTRAPERGEGHLGFGQGAHYCLGAALARQEAEVALRALFGRFPELTTAVPPDRIAFVARPGFTRVAELPVRPGPPA